MLGLLYRFFCNMTVTSPRLDDLLSNADLFGLFDNRKCSLDNPEFCKQAFLAFFPPSKNFRVRANPSLDRYGSQYCRFDPSIALLGAVLFRKTRRPRHALEPIGLETTEQAQTKAAGQKEMDHGVA